MPVLFAILLPLGLGLLAAALLFRRDGEASPGLLDRLAIAWPLGAGLVTFQLFLLALVRIPFSLGVMVPLLLAETAALGFFARKLGALVLPRPSFGLAADLASPAIAGWKKAAMAVLATWALAKLGSVALEAWLRPIFAWDSWANWSASAKVFYHAKGLLLDAPPADFFGGNAVSRIQSYPLHNHLLQVWFALWSGGFDEVLVKLWSPMNFLTLAGLLYGFSLREAGRTTALAILVIFISSPLMSYHATEAYSDLMLGALLCFALLSFLRAMRGGAGSWPLIGFFSALALFTKNEAPGFVFPLLLSAAFWLWTNRSQVPLAGTLARMLAPLLFAVPWFLFKFTYALSLTQDAHRMQPVWHPGVLEFVVKAILSFQNYGIVLAALPVLLLLNGRPSRELLHVLFPVAFFVSFFILLYYLIEYYYSTLFMGTIFFRNMMTWYPSAVAVLVLVLGSLLQKTVLPAAVPAAAPGRPAKKKRERSGP